MASTGSIHVRKYFRFGEKITSFRKLLEIQPRKFCQTLIFCAPICLTHVSEIKKVPSPNSFFRYFDFSNPTTLQKDVGKRQRQPACFVLVKLKWSGIMKSTRDHGHIGTNKIFRTFPINMCILFYISAKHGVAMAFKCHYDAPVWRRMRSSFCFKITIIIII